MILTLVPHDGRWSWMWNDNGFHDIPVSGIESTAEAAFAKALAAAKPEWLMS